MNGKLADMTITALFTTILDIPHYIDKALDRIFRRIDPEYKSAMGSIDELAAGKWGYKRRNDNR